MKLFDVSGKLVSVDVRDSSYPIKSKSRSTLQGQTAQWLVEKFPRQTILEDFTLPGSRMSVDFFLPNKGIVIEVQGRQHDEHVPHFHGDKATSIKFARQLGRDRKKTEWAETNGFDFIEVRDLKDLEQIDAG
jgi:very-short-patch-repair endonuclease